jgi:hypothetical protein
MPNPYKTDSRKKFQNNFFCALWKENPLKKSIDGNRLSFLPSCSGAYLGLPIDIKFLAEKKQRRLGICDFICHLIPLPEDMMRLESFHLAGIINF